MQLATHLRAPFIAPGRRNRKVHWNRPLSRAIASLGKFEQEDWRRALWLPESLRGFYPKWNNQFSPGGGSDCGCCGSSGVFCASCTTPVTDTYQIDFGNFTDHRCTNCNEDYSGQSYIVSFVSGGPSDPCIFRYTEGSGACSDLTVQMIMNGGGAADQVTHNLVHGGPSGISANQWLGASTDSDCGGWNLHQFDWSTGPTFGLFQVACAASDPCFATAL